MSDSDSDSSYVPDSDDSDMIEDTEEDDAVDVDVDVNSDPKTEIDIERVRKTLEEEQSSAAREIAEFCVAENEVLAKVVEAALSRVDALNDQKAVPNILANTARDAWLHILEEISDHVDDITKTIKHVA